MIEKALLAAFALADAGVVAAVIPCLVAEHVEKHAVDVVAAQVFEKSKRAITRMPFSWHFCTQLPKGSPCM